VRRLSTTADAHDHHA